MQSRFKAPLFALAGVALLASCSSNSNQWTLRGIIEGGEGKDIIVETQTFVGWSPIDTASIASDGSFAIRQSAKGYPDIFRARVGGSTIYFPIDSIETVTLNATYDNIADSYTLSGTDGAEAIMSVDKLLNQYAAEGKQASADSLVKSELVKIILREPSSIVAYYIINKSVDGHLLFSPESRRDVRIIGAVANAYNEKYPDHPRTAHLREVYLSNRTMAHPVTFEATAIGHHDINLYDENGKSRSLTETVDGSKIVVLSFCSYSAPDHLAYNRELNRVYEQWHDRGLQIYQVAVTDNDEVTSWRKGAANLPWITVYNSNVDGVQALLNYNVNELPTAFVINADGEVMERVDDPTKLSASIARHIR